MPRAPAACSWCRTAENVTRLRAAGLGPTHGAWPFVPLAPLLPRSRGIVHSGAHGTNALALAAGVPSVVIPCLFDQLWHARRQAELGTGVWVRRPRRLGAALRRLLARRVPAGRGRGAGPRHPGRGRHRDRSRPDRGVPAIDVSGYSASRIISVAMPTTRVRATLFVLPRHHGREEARGEAGLEEVEVALGAHERRDDERGERGRRDSGGAPAAPRAAPRRGGGRRRGTTPASRTCRCPATMIAVQTRFTGRARPTAGPARARRWSRRRCRHAAPTMIESVPAPSSAASTALAPPAGGRDRGRAAVHRGDEQDQEHERHREVERQRLRHAGPDGDADERADLPARPQGEAGADDVRPAGCRAPVTLSASSSGSDQRVIDTAYAWSVSR